MKMHTLWQKNFADKEGVLVGISSGAALKGAKDILENIAKDKKVLVIAPDGGEKYFSTGLYE